MTFNFNSDIISNNLLKDYNNNQFFYYSQVPCMNFDNIYNTTLDTIYPINDSNVPLLLMDNNNEASNILNDDDYSIVTASDLFYSTSPSLFSTHNAQLTPFSTPSPQLSESYGELNCCDRSYNLFSQEDLFAPVQENTKRKISPQSEKRHICPICSHRSKRRHNLVEHMLTHNPHRPKAFKCSHCSRPFARKYDMKRHEKIHLR